MDELVHWLRAQLDEDERIARVASGSTVVGEPGNWQPSPAGDEWEARASGVEEELLVALRPGLPRPPEVMSGYWGAWVSQESGSCDPAAGSAVPALTHAARHDPARVLREIDAKRQLINWVRKWPLRTHTPASADGVLELLALPYADRPGYREEWRP